MIIFENENQKLQEICEQLWEDSRSRSVFVIHVNGQLVSSVGDTSQLDMTSLASLVAASVSASKALANLLGEEDYPTHLYSGREGHLYTVRFSQNLILGVFLEDKKTTLGLVRLRIRGVLPKLREVSKTLEDEDSSDEILEVFKNLDLNEDLLDELF